MRRRGARRQEGVSHEAVHEAEKIVEPFVAVELASFVFGQWARLLLCQQLVDSCRDGVWRAKNRDALAYVEPCSVLKRERFEERLEVERQRHDRSLAQSSAARALFATAHP